MAPKADKESASNVFVKDKEWGWVPAVQLKVNGDKAVVKVWKYPNEQAVACDGGRAAKGKGEERTVNLKDYANEVLPLQNVDAQGNLVEFADMVKLPYLHEARILIILFEMHRFASVQPSKNISNIFSFASWICCRQLFCTT